MKLQSISVQVTIIEIKELLEKNGIRKEQWEIIKDEIDQKYKGGRMQRILKNIRILRIKKGDTIIEMAEKLKMTVPELSAIENGRVELPDDFFKKLFGVYNLSLKERSDFVTKKMKLTTRDRNIFLNRRRLKDYKIKED